MDNESRSSILRSEYYARAKASLPKEDERSSTLHRIIDEVHRQASDNLTLWHSEQNPGVSEVVSRVSVLKLIKSLGLTNFTDEQLNTEPNATTVHILSSAMPNPAFQTDASYAAFDMALDTVIRNIPQVVNNLRNPERSKRGPRDVVVLITGNPTAPGGTLTSEWVDRVEKNGSYTEFAKLHAEFIETELRNPKKEVVLIGHSYGGVMALLTARQFEKQFLSEGNPVVALKSHIKVLADSPVIKHGKDANKHRQGLRVIAGAALSGLSEMWHRRYDFLSKIWIGSAYKKQLIRNNIPVNDSLEQNLLRKRVYKKITSDLIHGPINENTTLEDSFYPHHIPTYIRLGAYDETLPDPARVQEYESWPKTFRNTYGNIGTSLVPPILERPRENVRVFGLNARHAIDRIRVNHWLRATNALLRSDEAPQAAA